MIETQDITNCVLIQNATLADVEKMICRAVDARMAAFYDAIRQKPPVMVPRIAVAQRLGISLPTLDKYGKFGILHPKHLGGKIYYDEAEIIKYQQNKK